MSHAAAIDLEQSRCAQGELNDEGCVETFERTKDRLEEVERRLAVRLEIRKNVRCQLIARDRGGLLVEDELVAEWHDLYASYLEWTREESWGPPERAHHDENSERGAAESGLAAFVRSAFWIGGMTHGTVLDHGARSSAEEVARSLLSWVDCPSH